MRNESTLVERIVLSKAIDGELRTFDIDLHRAGDGYQVYVYDPDEAFSPVARTHADYEQAKALFDDCVEKIIHEPVTFTDTVYDFAERIAEKLSLCGFDDSFADD